VTDNEKVLNRLAVLEERSQQHADDLLEIRRDVRYLVENLAGVKTRLAVVCSVIAVLSSQAARILFQ